MKEATRPASGQGSPGAQIPALGFKATGLLSTYYTLDRVLSTGTPWWLRQVPALGADLVRERGLLKVSQDRGAGPCLSLRLALPMP